jgi:hypothetical protein
MVAGGMREVEDNTSSIMVVWLPVELMLGDADGRLRIRLWTRT